MGDASVTEQLVAMVYSRGDELVGQELQNFSRYYLLDWLGSATAGMATETGGAFLNYAGALSAGSSSVLGLAEGRSTEVAALVNGALSHIVEMDDVERASVIHPAAVVIPAALAAADEVGASASQLLAAIAVGYEVAIRIGRAVGSKHYFHFHNTSTCGAFGAAAAAGWIYGLTEQQMVWALGNAGTQAAGLWEFNTEGAQSKPLHTGRAAANGVLAAMLARGGVTGARRILEGARGFFAGLAPEGHVPRVIEKLDGPFKIGEVSIKPHASCRHTHAPIDAALKLREQLDTPVDKIQQIELSVYQAAQVLCDKPDPQSVADAKFSLQYCVATALIRGQVGLGQFDEASMSDQSVRQLSRLVNISVDDHRESLYPQCWSSQLSITDASAEPFSAEIFNPKGDPENPLSQAELEQKFLGLAAYGLVPAQQVEMAQLLLQWVAGLVGEQPVDTCLLRQLRS